MLPASPVRLPTDDKLKQLVQIGSDAVPVHVLASIRQVVFEAQTLLISQVRAMLEKKDDDAKTELAPAERASRIRDQESRTKGLFPTLDYRSKQPSDPVMPTPRP